MSKELTESRKSFLEKLGRGIAGITMIVTIPKILLGKTRKSFAGIKVNVHPEAVKRNK